MFLLEAPKYFWLRSATIIGRGSGGTRMVRKLNIRLARRNGRLEMLRGQNQKKGRKCP